ncbi:cytochrome oxidase c assembly-domain-containing protein [Colletotrichum navitas]|uniref:Cytochrome oxidase c assembly-domain-containing protein n=1 Tax=Colletotrichum navitas TaxID=681940 RepID=A0AAD8V5L9_9PEZI|nr:cytochrome oxidase c assembly-domain-containing protein [Colletotrichum navitas]KAK1590479.1 cytochrome oxidase c assembly-domain-containing protein [Colletotrichum navitas]
MSAFGELGPRSASDATRFTSTTPHAASKSSPTLTTTTMTTGATGTAAAAAAPTSSPHPPPRVPGRPPGESPEERVRRLRAAHEAARAAQKSSVDRVIGGSRRFFDFAHKFTVLGLVGFTAIAGLISVYSVYDMVTYNKQRRADFIEAQRRMEEDSLAAARLAFINGTATDAQVTLVEEANARARETGVRLPPLLSAPTVTTQAEKIFGKGGHQQQQPLTPDSSFAAAPEAESSAPAAQKSSSWWPFGSSSAKPDQARGTIQESKELLQDKAKAAFERERENQRRGGALDQLGLPQEEKKVEKNGWW